MQVTFESSSPYEPYIAQLPQHVRDFVYERCAVASGLHPLQTAEAYAAKVARAEHARAERTAAKVNDILKAIKDHEAVLASTPPASRASFLFLKMRGAVRRYPSRPGIKYIRQVLSNSF